MISETPVAKAAERWGTDIAIEDVLGSPCRMFSDRLHHVSELLHDARRFDDRTHLVHGDRRLTFAEHERAVLAVAAMLRNRGVQPGDRVLIFGANSIEWVVGFWAAMNVGAVVVPGNAWWSADELGHAIAMTEPRLALCDAKRMARLDGVAPVAFSELAAEFEAGVAAADVAATTGSENDPAVLLFTSGTTGLPKAAVLSQRGVIANLHSLLCLTNRLPGRSAATERASVTLVSVPLFHVGGFQQLLTALITGGTLIFAEGRFDPDEVLQTIDRDQVRVWAAVPTMVERVIEAASATTGFDLSSVRTVTLGGAAVSDRLREQVRMLFANAARGTGVSYGLTEAGGVVATAAGSDLIDHPGTVGRAVPIAEVRIDAPDAEGRGEILVRSPAVMDGYWQADSSDAFAGQRWLRSGDLGRLDEDGFLYVTGRIKDVIIRAGENISPTGVEARIATHPDVRQVAVIGLPHPDLGEEVGAVVVARDDAELTVAQLQDHLVPLLSRIAIPTAWWLRAEGLPVNPAGKVLKRVLRNEWIQSRCLPN
jgi:long-chain acyl-CoA synthetase